VSDEKDKGQDKTEEPSDKRRRDFREKGRVAQSKDLASVGVLLAVGLSMAVSWRFVLTRASRVTEEMLADASGSPELFMDDPLQLLRMTVFTTLVMVAPVLIAAVVSGFLLAVAQVGLQWSWKPLEPDLNKMNPVEGLKSKLFSMQAVFEWLKAMAKVAIVGVVSWRMVVKYSPGLTELAGLGLADSVRWSGTVLVRLVGFCLLAMLALGIVDLFFAKWQLLKKMRMTKQELKEENKEMEGDPYMKARVRNLMAEMGRNRLVAEVTEATVVVANPTHYAVAIKYDMGQPGPPVVVARGADARAIRIKDIARSNGIPRIENRPLARALYAQCKPGMTVPVDLYEATAEVLAFVYRLRESRRPAARPAPQHPPPMSPAL